MMQYNRTEIEKKKRIIELNNVIIDNDENIRISENLAYVFRMFLISTLFIAILLWISG